MKKILKNKHIVFLAAFFLVMSCDSVTEFNQYKKIENNSWKAEELISFQFEIKDTILPKNLFFNIRNNNQYKYSNLYVIAALNFPDSTTVVDTLQYKMADAAGRFLGNGFTEIKENKLFYKEHKIFPIAGSYSVSIRQAMRKNGAIQPITSLEGILDVGLSIEKSK